MPMITPCAMYLSMTALCLGNTLMMVSIEAPDGSAMMTAFMILSYFISTHWYDINSGAFAISTHNQNVPF
jgi:hypothetical protein